MRRETRIIECWLIFGLASGALSFPFGDDHQRYEGSPCQVSGKIGPERDGVCVKLEDCPSKLEEFLRTRTYNLADRCGFKNFSEIVCCSPDIARRLNPPRPAEAACQEYGNEVQYIEKAITFHILGGVEARQNEFPYMAALGYNSSSDDDTTTRIRYNCGGTLISQQHVLTAAHCVRNLDESVPVEVKLGCTDYNVNDVNTQRIEVDTVIPYPEYRRGQNYHDIAILKLKEPVRLTNSVQPACLTTKPLTSYDEFNTVNSSLIVIGWGQTSFDGDVTNQLKKAAGLAFVAKDNCSVSYSTTNKRLSRGLDDAMICAMDPDRERRADACLGDSGGPLLFSIRSRSMLAGITAFGQACGSSIPSVYMSVYDYLSWIESNVWPSSEEQRSLKVT